MNTIIYSIVVDSNDYIFASTSTRTPGPFGFYVGKLICSADDGLSWITLDSDLEGSILNTLSINSVNTFFGGGGNGAIYRSTENGITWVQVHNGDIGDNITALAFDSNDNILAGSFSGDSSGQIYHSTDIGNTWFALTHVGRSIYSLTVNQGDTIFVGTYDAPSNDGGIYRSINNGLNWSQVGLHGMSISSILIYDFRIFAATYEDGIYYSTNGGEDWTSINSGLDNGMIRVINISPIGFLFAGTIGGGIYRSVEPVTSIKDFGKEIPTRFSLQQNYPNPFNPSTKIDFSLPLSAKVKIKVYDILGNEIETLIDEYRQSGYYEVEFDGNELPSGIYFYRLISSKYTETKKMILLR
ncbi:MAG: hypothetical protein A2V93_02535 [Ignavibacteria bacterium RBG_16_34_14]|nr:MAG: hypothetical protein A2V93_02535 [Ignavibacteria bacterium RBG_16_34_14]